MTLTATAQPTNAPPRVLLNVSGVTGTQVSVFRLDPDGRTRPVRAAELTALTSGGWTGSDYEAPYGVPVTYTALPADASTTQTSSSVTLTVDDVWLIHPGVPDLSVAVAPENVETFEPRVSAARSGVHQPLGRVTPIVVSEARASTQSGITFHTDTLLDRDAVTALLGDGSALLLNVPPSLAWGVTSEWVAVGDVTETAEHGGDELRHISFPYTVVDRPVGGIQAQWTWGGVLAGYASWADVLAAYGTWSDVLLNTP